MGPALETQFVTFGMEPVDLKAITGDDQAFRFYMVAGMATMSERVANLSESVKTLSKEQALNKERLIQIDIQGPHALAERVAAHDKWMEDIRKQISDHIVHCPVIDRMAVVEKSLQDVATEMAARTGTLKVIPEMQKQLQDLTVSVAENTGARGQKESDWRTTLIMIGMALSALFSLIGLFRKG